MKYTSLIMKKDTNQIVTYGLCNNLFLRANFRWLLASFRKYFIDCVKFYFVKLNFYFIYDMADASFKVLQQVAVFSILTRLLKKIKQKEIQWCILRTYTLSSYTHLNHFPSVTWCLQFSQTIEGTQQRYVITYQKAAFHCALHL